jgi:hypothetical protein
MRGATIGPAHHGTMKVCPFLCPLSTEFHAIQYETAGLENLAWRPDLLVQVTWCDSVANQGAATVNRRVAGSSPA